MLPSRRSLLALTLLLLIGPPAARAQGDAQAADDEKLLKAVDVIGERLQANQSSGGSWFGWDTVAIVAGAALGLWLLIGLVRMGGTRNTDRPGFVPGFAVTYHIISDGTAVPEPGSLALLGTLSGPAALALGRKRLVRR